MIALARLTSPASRSLLGLSSLVLVLGCAGCAAASPTARTATSAKHALTQEELHRRFERFMARENGPFARHDVELLGGRVAGSIESATPPEVECEGATCQLIANLGVDADGDPNSIVCSVSTGLEPFGPHVLEVVGEARLAETPRLVTREAGEGLAVSFVANATIEADDDVLVATPKVAALYARGYTARCHDFQPGGRKTFDRVVGDFFDGLKASENAARHNVFSVGYQLREGEEQKGFRFDFVSRRGDDTPGYQELSATFMVATEGQGWKVLDTLRSVTRDETGAIESISRNMWMNGNGPLRVSAKPAEGQKMRVKIETGTSVNALELTPPAPANTEIWAAPDLLAVSTGRAPSYTYSVPSIHERDPSLRTVTLKRSAPGVLIETHGASAKNGASDEDAAEDEQGNELHVDARGLVTKEITASSVAEMLFSWGELPATRGRTRIATKSAAGAARGAK